MEVSVKHIVELGPNTMAFIAGLMGAATTPAAPTKADKPAATPKAETPAAPKAETPAKPVAPKAEPKTKKDDAADFDGLDEDAKLEAIKTEITKHTKKGKSADIKALLSGFDAARASELATDRYNEFFAAVKRYGAGETVDAILSGDGEDLV